MRAIVVTGGRDVVPTKETLAAFWRWRVATIGDDFVLICGDAKGTDTTVAKFVDGKGFHVLHVPALWGPLGKAAGPLRNKRMCELAQLLDRHAILVAWPGGKGTDSCRAWAKYYGIQVLTAAEIVKGWGL